MTLLTSRPATATPRKAEATAPKTIAPTKTRTYPVPIGAPKESHATEVLLTLRSRLEAQVNSDGHSSPEEKVIREAARYRLEQVEVALARIREGKYGLCTECLGPIEADRLVIRPFTTLCSNCQNHLEHHKPARP